MSPENPHWNWDQRVSVQRLLTAIPQEMLASLTHTRGWLHDFTKRIAAVFAIEALWLCLQSENFDWIRDCVAEMRWIDSEEIYLKLAQAAKVVWGKLQSEYEKYKELQKRSKEREKLENERRILWFCQCISIIMALPPQIPRAKDGAVVSWLDNFFPDIIIAIRELAETERNRPTYSDIYPFASEIVYLGLTRISRRAAARTNQNKIEVLVSEGRRKTPQELTILGLVCGNWSLKLKKWRSRLGYPWQIHDSARFR